MNNEEFRIEVEKKLDNFNKEKIIYFSWLCTVRVLPVLGIDGSFTYWEADDRCDQYLCSVFHALDITADIIRLFDTKFPQCINGYTENTCYCVDNNLRKIAREVLHATDAATIYARNAINQVSSLQMPQDKAVASNSARAAYAARFVANSAANAAFAAADAALQTDRESAIRSAASAAASAAATADAACAYAVSFWKNINFPNLYITLMDDLQSIQMDRPLTNFGKTGLMGDIWSNFLNALESENCSYWGNLYEQISDNGFIIDLEATRQRVNVPESIQKQGASAVAKYLERAENADC